MLRLTLTALLPVVSLGTVATAQSETNQTPEGAQRFMAGVLPDTEFVDHRLGDVSLSPDLPPRLRSILQIKDSNSVAGEYIRNLSALLRRSHIRSFKNGDNVCISYIEILSGSVEDSPPEKYVYREPQTTTITLDWTKVVSARSAGSSAFVLTRQPGVPLSPIQKANGTREIEFRLPDDGLAARAAYAAEFLRLSCDPVADTGF